MTAPAVAAPRNVLWRPNPGAQGRFLSTGSREVLFGGRAGGGKTDSLLIAAMRQAGNPAHRAIIFRRSFPRLKDLISRSWELFLPLGATYNKVERQWTFPTGAVVEFGYLDAAEDVYVYQGRAFSFIGFDELGEWPADDTDPTGEPINRAYLYMVSRLRSVAGSGLRLQIRGTCNPGGPGHGWMQKRWRIGGSGEPTCFPDPVTGYFREFIPAGLCPQLSGTGYEKTLDALAAEDRLALKDGRWDAMRDDGVFLPFDLLTPCQYPLNAKWRRPLAECGELFVGVDVGRVHDLTVFWVLERAEDVFFTRELVTLKATPFEAQKLALAEIMDRPNVRRCCIDETGIGSDLAEWARTRYPYRAEGVTFTAGMKESLAYPLRSAFERRALRVPAEQPVTDDLRAVRREHTAAGNVRFDAARTGDGHADRFWALALAIHAAERPATSFAATLI